MPDAAAFWDRIAERYAKLPIRAPEAYEATLDRVRAHLRPGARVLELGCGAGTTAIRLADAAGTILATDFADAMLTIGRQRAAEAGVGNVAFARRDAARAADDGPFDAVLAFNLLHLVEDMDSVLAAMAAALKPGGMLAVKAICLREPGMSWRFRAALGLLLPVLQALGRAPRLRRLTVAEFEAAITRAGFEIAETANHPERPVNRLVIAHRPGGGVRTP
jgi:ubiquinone/menaquinone biosynthesis C-methylase UbiE